MTEDTLPERIASLRDQARNNIRAGFAELDDLYEYVTDEEVPEQQARDIIDQEWQTRLAEQKDWTTPSDFDRLSAVFAELERKRIVARMNFTCCGTCGHAEIEMERDESLPDATGYVFFHQQDADSLGDAPTTLYLRYGTFEEPEIAGDYGPLELTVARTIESLLVEHGFPIEPVADSWTCVTVTIQDWRKPLPEPASA